MIQNQNSERHKIEYVEQNLASYRANKRKQDQTQTIKKILFTYFVKISNFICLPIQYILPERNNYLPNVNDKKDHGSNPKNKNCSYMSEHSEEFLEVDDDITISRIFGAYTCIDWVILSLKCILWIIAWKIFILMEFGAIFFLLSCFAFIWFNLNSDVERNGFSAYSVFNPNCEQITGSFTAEKFEKELLNR